MQLPSRKTLLGGIGGLAVWGIGYMLKYAGIDVPDDAITGSVILITALLHHFVSPSIQDKANVLNIDVEDLAKWLPNPIYPNEK